MNIQFRERSVNLKAGEMIVVPRGVEHKPWTKKECKILLVEPKGIINTGDKKNHLTINEDIWV